MDPEMTFPQISELAVGPPSAKALYRIGFAAIAALLASLVLLHKDLAMPHLPGGRSGTLGEDFTWYGLAAAGGIALQGVFVLETRLSWQTGFHLLGAAFFFYGAWCFMGAAQKLYLPSDGLPSDEDSPVFQAVSEAVEAAAQSRLLQLPSVNILTQFRHRLLMRGPMFLFIVPLASQFLERAGPPK